MERDACADYQIMQDLANCERRVSTETNRTKAASRLRVFCREAVRVSGARALAALPHVSLASGRQRKGTMLHARRWSSQQTAEEVTASTT
ncbi:uncharacterized protein SCHCODRAFT_02119847 [Schizophyllum commune H4-8]|uniref:uncharacterized protein n=1 Tax=Schizophyllum commune (strain H4-8 / FGSC 9210) TaxID=578458 RepID=UPI00215F7BA5|nr:uncharacterized protein SCHCODRAFT_02119847 [Schizophyllum commune H4-8]KAI5885625.1 hypothetical protein SCHCODRAFT_02119847 [Schizophyllum commune H4-8]